MANYRVRLEYDAARSVFVARAPELPSCSAEGVTRAAALEALEDEIEAQVATMSEQGATPPTPVDELAMPAADDDSPPRGSLDGRVSAKVSPSLHRELAFLARAEGMPLGVLVAELLSESLALRSARELRGPPRPRGRGNQRDGNQRDGNRRDGNRRDDRGPSYNQIMEDKASFLDYVRKQEQGQGNQRRGRGRRGKRRDGSDD